MSDQNIPKPNSFFAQYLNITKKEIKIQIRYPIAFIASFIRIFMIILIFTLVAKIFIGSNSESGNEAIVSASTLSTYMVLGLMAFLFFSDALFTSGLSLRNEQITGTLETLFLYPVNHLANLFSKITWSVFLNFFLILFGVIVMEFISGSVLITFPEIIFGLIIFLMYLIQIFGFAFFLAGLNLKLKESILPLVNFLQFVFMLLGAVFFPFAALGPVVFFSYLIPFSYTIDLMRTTIFGFDPELALIFMNTFGFGSEIIFVQWGISIFLTLALPIIGYKYFIRTINHGRSTGTLSDY